MAENSQQPTDQNAPGQDAASSNPRMQLRVDDSKMSTHYVNAFRTNPTAEEVVLDTGFNVVEQQPRAAGDGNQSQDGQARFMLNERMIMNYKTAKRLALALGQVVRRYEQHYGEIQLGGENQPHEQQPASQS